MGGARASFEVATTGPFDVVDITQRVSDLVPPGLDGLAFVQLPHTTAGLMLGPNDDGILRDYVRVAQRWLASCGPFEHIENNNPNAEAHILSAFGGTRLLLTATAGRLDIGRFQRILLLEWDGPQRRTVQVGPFVPTAAVAGVSP